MDQIAIEGVIITPLKKIHHPQGDIWHGMKKSDPGYNKFGEAYFSTIKKGYVKPWKKHIEMTLNIIVPEGTIRFVLYDDRDNSATKYQFQEVYLSNANYQRLTIPPGIWMAFEGVGDQPNLLLNIADLEHNPEEIARKNLSDIPYKWH